MTHSRQGSDTRLLRAGPEPSARAVAAGIVRRWLETGDFPDRLLDEVRNDRGFVTEVVCGAVKWRRALDFVVRQVADRRPDPVLRASLLTGLYEMFHMKAADHAVVHETVAAVRRTCPARQAGFVNAVLRRALRERDALSAALQAQAIGIRLSHPDVLIDRWTARYGAEGVSRLCAWDNEAPPLTLRVNPAMGPVASFAADLAATGCEASPHAFDPARFVTLARGRDVRTLPGYAQGRFTVQDPSTMGAVDLLDPRPGESVMDACAAPGGKTMAIAERMAGSGRLVALDLHADRLPALRENLARMGHAWVTVGEADLTELPAAFGEPCDAILLDVPCSNTGVLRRRPDARWRFTEARLATLVETQCALLEAAAGQVKPGGRIVYSTCSLEAEEGEHLVHTWLAGHPRFTQEAACRVTPLADGVDGAYAVRLRCNL